ncbi:HAD family hydrolase [Melittangium boletus]|uniref:HAD family hydrolase n=1 Tax=Melittangium boletus TaxID=83453 RepID=UPI003DA47C3D
MTGAVIFDRDGVLAEFDLEGVRQELGHLLPFGLEQLGTHLRDWAPRSGRRVTCATSERAFWSAFWEELCDAHGLDANARAGLLRFEPCRTLRLFADARPAVERARRQGYRVGVLSNFALFDLPGSLAWLGLTPLVDAALSAAMLGASKPAPETYLAMARALGQRPEDCLFVDDRPDCVEGARRVGMRAWLLDRSGKRPGGEGVMRDLTALLAD